MSAPQLVRGAPRALHRALAVAAVNRHDVREREPLLHYRNAEQLDLRDGADVVAKVGEEHRRIEVALVIGDENQQQKRDEEGPVVSNHIAREWGVGSGEWGVGEKRGP